MIPCAPGGARKHVKYKNDLKRLFEHKVRISQLRENLASFMIIIDIVIPSLYINRRLEEMAICAAGNDIKRKGERI